MSIILCFYVVDLTLDNGKQLKSHKNCYQLMKDCKIEQSKLSNYTRRLNCSKEKVGE